MGDVGITLYSLNRPMASCPFRISWLPAVAAALATISWFSPGRFIAGGDVPPFVYRGVAPEIGWLWGHSLTGAGSVTAAAPLALPMLVAKATHALGGSDLLAQRIFYLAIMAFMGFAGALLASTVTAAPAAVAFGGLVTVFNAFVLTQVPNSLVLLAMGLMALLAAMIVRARQGQRAPPVAFAVATVLVSYVASNPPLLAIVVIWTVGTVVACLLSPDRAARSRVRRFLWVAAPWTVALNLWWIVPSLVAITSTVGGVQLVAETDVRAWSWTHRRNSVENVLGLNTTWAWDFREYFPYAPALNAPLIDSLRLLLPIAALSAPLLARRDRRRPALGLLATALVVVFIGKGLHPPLGGVNLWLYDHFPGMFLLREPMGKVGMALVLLYALLAAITAEGVARRVARWAERIRPAGFALAATGAAAALVYAYPMVTGDVVPHERPSLPSPRVALPEWWRAATLYLDSRPQGKVLVLPLDDFYQMPTTWGFYGTDQVAQSLLTRPVLQILPGGYFSGTDVVSSLLKSTERALLRKDGETAQRLLGALGVTDVILRHDLDLSFPERSFTAPKILEPGLRAVLTFDKRFGDLDVFKVPNAQGTVRLATDITTHGKIFSTSANSAPSKQASFIAPVPESLARPLQWSSPNPATYRVSLPAHAGPSLLVLAETFAPGWSLSGVGGARHLIVDGYANGWVLTAHKATEVTLSFRPARAGRFSLWASAGAAIAAIVVASFGVATRRMRTIRRHWDHGK